MQPKTITVIASQDVGYRCLSWLLQEKYPVTQVFLGTVGDLEIKRLCEQHKIACAVFTDEGLLHSNDCTWLLSLWNPNLISSSGLAKAQFRLNLHPALVPYCRGNDTAAWAILTGVPTGVSLLEMDSGVDTGDIWAQRPLELTVTTKGSDLLARMKAELIELFQADWPRIFSGTIIPKPQTERLPAYTRRQTNENRVRKIEDFQGAEELLVWLRAHDFAPRSTAELEIEGARYSVTLVFDRVSD